MRKASEYRQQAEECRKLLVKARSQEHREMLKTMAATWERLADERERQGFRAVAPPAIDSSRDAAA
jgi:hypothetical protein